MKQNILRNHAGAEKSKWFLSVRSYRSNFGNMQGFQADRSMCALTMNNHVFVLLEDPAAPSRADYLAAIGQTGQTPLPTGAVGSPEKQPGQTQLPEPPHYRNTFLTVSPPGALEQLIGQLSARWVSTRQPSTNVRTSAPTSGNQLVIDGSVFSIGTDWLVRVGNVILAGGAVKGMLLEVRSLYQQCCYKSKGPSIFQAEYLPLPTMHSPTQDGTSELLSNLLISILPNVANATPVAVSITDSQWEEVLWNRSEPEDEDETPKKSDITEGEDNIYTYEDEDDPSIKQKGDWTGVDRDRRSAFLIIGALKSEGIL